MFGFYWLKDLKESVYAIRNMAEVTEQQVSNLASGNSDLADMMALEERITKLEKARGPRGKAKR